MHAHDIRKRYRTAARRANENALEVQLRETVRSVSLRINAERTVQIREVIDVIGSHIDRKRAEHIRNRNADLLCFVAIDVDDELGSIGMKRRVDRTQGRILIRAANELLCSLA